MVARFYSDHHQGINFLTGSHHMTARSLRVTESYPDLNPEYMI